VTLDRISTLRLVSEIAKVDEERASEHLQTCNGEVETAIVVQVGHCSAEKARECLAEANGQLRLALDAFHADEQGTRS